MSGSNGIDLDSYLNVTRPKPIKQKSKQEIFDHVVRTLYAQVVPAVRVEFPFDSEEPDVTVLTFNSYSKTSPIMCFFTKEDMKVLTAAFGYVELQGVSNDALLGAIVLNEQLRRPENEKDTYCLERADDYMHELSLSQKEALQKLLQTLELRGVFPKDYDFLRDLHLSYTLWAETICNYTTFSTAASCDDPEYCKAKLYRYFIDDVRRWGLKDSVLKFSP